VNISDFYRLETQFLDYYNNVIQLLYFVVRHCNVIVLAENWSCVQHPICGGCVCCSIVIAQTVSSEIFLLFSEVGHVIII